MIFQDNNKKEFDNEQKEVEKVDEKVDEKVEDKEEKKEEEQEKEDKPEKKIINSEEEAKARIAEKRREMKVTFVTFYYNIDNSKKST